MVGMSGYFGITSTRINLFRLLTLYAQIRFYVWSLFWIGAYFGLVSLNDWRVWYMIQCPVLSGSHWYASAYLAMIWVTPGLNWMGRSLSRMQYLIAIIGLLIAEFDACRGDREGRRAAFRGPDRGYSAVHLGIVYFMAGYCRLHAGLIPRIVILFLYGLVFKIVYEILKNPWLITNWLHNHWLGLWGCNFLLNTGSLYYDSVPAIILGLLTLCVCAGLELPAMIGNCFVFLGSFSFASYLIHDHPLCSHQLGDWWFRAPESRQTPELAQMNGYRYAISVFLFCTTIDVYRHYLWESCVVVNSASWRRVKKVWGILRPNCASDTTINRDRLGSNSH
jgi:hypothetical protein